MAQIYDTHAHLSDRCFEADFGPLLARAAEAGVGKIVCMATDLETSQAVVRLSETHPGLYAAVGWHPNHALEAPEDVRPALRALARHPRVVAIGETGLDYYRLPSNQGGNPADDGPLKERQQALLEQQIEVAAELGLPLVIHQRGEVFEDTEARLRPWAGRVRAVFHCFMGDMATLGRVLDLGALVSFTGNLTYKNSQPMREALKAAPLDRFMFETDCPYLAPMPHRGKRCEPAHVKDTASFAALVRGCTFDEIAEATTATAERFFSRLAGGPTLSGAMS
jgi:TatD DNase family protein